MKVAPLADCESVAIILSVRMQFSKYSKGIFRFILLILFALSSTTFLHAQDSDKDYEEISVFLNVQGIGGFDVTAIYKNDQIYLPISELFQCLKINQQTSEFNDTISGFFLDENNKYIISQESRTIFIDGKLIQLNKDELLNTETTSLALRLDQYGKIFGLDCRFNFSSLSVELKTSHELPVIKELRLEQMRKNISRLRGEIKVDTTYKRKYHLFRGGMADWAIYSNQVTGGTSETRAMLGLGTEFLGGETNIELNYSSRNNFEKRQQQYHWRWANNDTKLVKQITVGKIASRSIASIYSPLLGTVITNTPTTYRRSFGSYTMSDFTEPGWTVELYINNVIVDFTTADASGFYKFDIPLVYGSSDVLIKFYGPWGEERLKEEHINIPFNFLPSGEFQYTIAGAMVQDTSHSIFTHGEVNFGINRHLTVGGGIEYLSSISSAPSIPFINGSVQLLGNVLLNGEYAYGVRTKALLSYSLPSNFVFDIDYTKYANEQKAITFNYLEERKIRVSIPIYIKKFKVYSRLSYSQNILRETTYSTAEATISTFFNGVSANFTGNANWLGKYDPFIYGNLGLGFRFFKTLSFRPQVQYDFSNNSLIYTKAELENNFSPRCNLSLVWENNIRNNINSVELTFRYDLSFAQVSLNTRVTNDYIMTGQSARGSFAFGSGNGRILADRRTQVGRAGLTVIPFLDINNNNHRDDNEPITKGMDLRINGGRILPDSKDSIIRILDLEPFASYMLEFNDTQFDNIAWQIKDKTVSILMDPNQFKLLEVPIKVMGEINGTIYMQKGGSLREQGRIQVNIFDDNDNFIAKTQSESDGYFNYLGLGPGSYYAEVDTMQLSRLKAVSKPERFEFEIHATTYGDIIDNIEFQLLKSTGETEELAVTEQKKTEIKPAAKEQLTVTTKKTVLLTPLFDISNQPTESHKFFIQAGAFKKQRNAERRMRDLSNLTSKSWFVIQENGLYKVRFGYFDSKETANNFRTSLDTPGIYYYISEIPFITKPDQQQKRPEIAPQKQGSDKGPEKPSTINNVASIIPSFDCEDSLHPQNGYFIQAGAFAIKSNADKLTAKLIATTGQNWFIACGKGLYKVRLGYFTTKNEARNIVRSLNKIGIEYYVNKPEGVEIPKQPKVDMQIDGQKQTMPQQSIIPAENQKTQAEPEKVPDLKETTGKEQELPKAIKNEAIIPQAKKELPAHAQAAEPAIKLTKDGTVITPTIDETNKATSSDRFFIQAGAFDSRVHAERLAKDLLKLTLKRWFVAYEDGLYKVRLGYFNTKEAATFVEGTLNTNEVPYYVDGTSEVVKPIELKNNKESRDQKRKEKDRQSAKNKAAEPETIPANAVDDSNTRIQKPEEPKTRRNALIETPPNGSRNTGTESHRFYIQADAFTSRTSAEQLASDLLIRTRREWFIVFEEQLYKVRLGYFDSKDEAKYIEGTLNTPDVRYNIDEIPVE
ncbi:MAG: SPOR domain-containing protein [Lentimicrobiaceae bacterium]|jgi:cell division protein FtsN